MTMDYDKSPEAAMVRGLKSGRIRYADEPTASGELLQTCREIASRTTVMTRDSDAFLNGDWDEHLPRVMREIAGGRTVVVSHDCNKAPRP